MLMLKLNDVTYAKSSRNIQIQIKDEEKYKYFNILCQANAKKNTLDHVNRITEIYLQRSICRFFFFFFFCHFSALSSSSSRCLSQTDTANDEEKKKERMSHRSTISAWPLLLPDHFSHFIIGQRARLHASQLLVSPHTLICIIAIIYLLICGIYTVVFRLLPFALDWFTFLSSLPHDGAKVRSDFAVNSMIMDGMNGCRDTRAPLNTHF